MRAWAWGWGALQANSLDGIRLDHNLWYLPGVSDPFLWGSTVYDHAGWVAATGHGDGDVVADPLFAGSWALPADNLRLTEPSPAVDAAVAEANVTHDFAGGVRPFGSAPDIGAFEYGASAGGSGATGAGGPAGGGGAGASSSGGESAGGMGSGAIGASASGGAAVGANATAPGDDSGCGCRLAASRPALGGAMAAWIGTIAWLLRRRRAHGR